MWVKGQRLKNCTKLDAEVLYANVHHKAKMLLINFEVLQSYQDMREMKYLLKKFVQSMENMLITCNLPMTYPQKIVTTCTHKD